MSLVPYVCPTHGLIFDTVPRALVTCGRCGTVVDEEGRTNGAASKHYHARRATRKRVRRYRSARKAA